MAEENKEYLLKDKFASKFANVNFGYVSYQINNSDLEHTYSYIDYLPIEVKEKNQITHTFKLEQEKEGETKKYGSIILTLDEKRNNIIGFEYKKDDNVYKHEFKNSISIQNILDDNSCMDNLFKNHINNTLQKFLLTEEEKNKEDILNRDTNSQNNNNDNNDNNDNSDTHISPESSSKKSSGVASTIFSTLLGGAAFAAITLTTPLGIYVAIATALSTFGITKSISKLFGKNQSSTYNYNTSYQQNVSDNPDLLEAINCAFKNHDNENNNENNNNNNSNNNENENKNPDNSNNSKPKNLDALSGVGGDNNASQPPKAGDDNKPKGNTPDQTPNI